MRTNTISDEALVLSRVNYGEADRILSVLCARHGKLSVIAKGVRAGRSKLAGGVELFAENELVLLKGKGDLYIVTSSRMRKYFGDIARDIDASSYAYECLKIVNKLVPVGSGEEYYHSLKKLLDALDKNKIPLVQIKIWFGLEVLDISGSLPNFHNDNKGGVLSVDSNLNYDFEQHCFIGHPDGAYSSEHVKVLRHLARAAKPVEIKTKDDSLMQEVENLVSIILKNNLG